MTDYSFAITYGCIVTGILLAWYVQKRVDEIGKQPIPSPPIDDQPKTFDEISSYWWCRGAFETPRKWKLYIALSGLTIQDRDAAFKFVFGYYPWQCRVNYSGTGALNVFTPSGICCSGGFGFHTDTPTLKKPFDIWHFGGIDWGIDCNGQRYYKLDHHTGLPTNFEMVKQEYILAHFLYTFEEGPDLVNGLFKPKQDES